MTCFDDNNQTRSGCESAVIAIISLITHTVLSCLSIVVLIETKDVARLQSSQDLNPICLAVKEYFGQLDPTTIHVVFGIALFMGLLGVISAAILLIGLKYEKSGYVIVYLSFGLQTTIVLLLGVLFCLIKYHWYSAMVFFILTVVYAYILIVINRTYDKMVCNLLPSSSDALEQDIMSTTEDLQLLLED